MSWRNPDHQYKRFKGKDHLRCEACGKGNPGYKVVYDETGPKATECRYCKHLKSFPNKSVKCECAFCKPSTKTATSLAEFKRKLQVGSKWQALNHIDQKDLGIREVSKVQTNAVAFKMPNGRDSWLYFPKAKDLKVEGDSFTVLEDGTPILTYKKVNENKIASKVAERFKQAFLSVKLPVNYALVVNCKKLLAEHNLDCDDEMLEEILSRYLDLVIYGLCNDNTPTKEDLLNVATEVMGEYDDIELFDDSGDYEDDPEADSFEDDEGERF